jgi:hypothetical protein
MSTANSANNTYEASDTISNTRKQNMMRLETSWCGWDKRTISCPWSPGLIPM